ncbi:MAG TPA: PAS domain S-box protein, partial [Verrucomicrobiae bacterium]|nr:PAS domain S-box protein [Verrucomicrobiae bacterium]
CPEAREGIIMTADGPGPRRTKTAVNKPLTVLIVEDSENDATLLEIELERSGFTPKCRRVENRAQMLEALSEQSWDLIIADYVMPHFNGLEALGLAKDHHLDIPFIVVSGHISEDTAVAAMKAGAHDYVMKDNLTRLGAAVRRELREAEARREQRHTDERLKAEQVFRRAIENSVPCGITAVDLEGRLSYVNPAFCSMTGWSEHELIGTFPPFPFWPQDQTEEITRALAKVVEGDAAGGSLELRFRRHSGERIDVLLQITPLKDAFGSITGWVSSVSDITERKRAETRLAAEHAITRALAGAQTLGEAAPTLLQLLLESLEMDIGTLWVQDADLGVLCHCATHVRVPSPRLEALFPVNRQLRFAQGQGLPGRVWHDHHASWVPDLASEPNLQRRKLITEAGLVSGACFPIQNGGLAGVLEFFSSHHVEHDSRLDNMMLAITTDIAQFIQRRRAEEALRRAHDELEMRVQQRTAELKAANDQLQGSIIERKRLETELLDITERERRRIGLDLHDDLGQKLSGIALMTKGLELRLAKDKAEGAKDAARIHSLVQQAMSHASDLAHDLATLDLAEKDLPGALEELAARARQLFGISCKFARTGVIPALDSGVIGQLYKVAQEAVTNAIKHGKANRVNISLTNGDNRLKLVIQNDGLPFPDLRSDATGMGLRIMNYRANLIGAALDIRAKGNTGTVVTCSVPLEAKNKTGAPSP